MSKALVVVEGRTDEVILHRLIRPELLAHVRFKVAGGSAGLTSFARSAFTVHRGPVVLVTDADTTNPRAVREKMREKEELLQMASGGLPCAVVLATPEIEAVFFHDPSVLNSLLRTPPTEEQRVRGRFEPRKVLMELLSKEPAPWTAETLASALTEDQASLLREHPAARELNGFLATVSSDEMQPA